MEFIQIIVPVCIIILAMITGSILEKNHYKSIHEREEKYKNLPAVPYEMVVAEQPVAQTLMVVGSVVVSIDHFKRFLARLVNIVGGRIRAYESLVDRGRREAILRMKEQCPNADIIVNMRIETSSVSKSHDSVGTVEVIAYGTAVTYQK